MDLIHILSHIHRNVFNNSYLSTETVKTWSKRVFLARKAYQMERLKISFVGKSFNKEAYNRLSSSSRLLSKVESK